jgi:steroid Delta-isomerase
MSSLINPAVTWTASMEEHPARVASWRAYDALARKDKNAYLAAYAEDGIIHDPVGPTDADPEGAGHRGHAAISVFWDNLVAPIEEFRFAFSSSYAAGDEVANTGRVTAFLAGDQVMDIDCVFLYQVNDAGLLVSVRGYWETEQVSNSIRKR